MLVLDAQREPTLSAAQKAWDWDAGQRYACSLAQMADGFHVVEMRPSPDGQRLAMLLQKEPDNLQLRVGDQLYPTVLEKAWHLRFFPDNRAFALVRIDDEWTVMVDGELWENRWEFAWNPVLSNDGQVLAVQIKRGMEYSIARNGQAWEKSFLSIREYALSHDGSRVAAGAQVEELPEADIFKFLRGTWTVVVDEKPWARTFLNVFAPIFSPDGARVAAEVRTDICEYTVAEDEKLWPETFGCVWEPRYRNSDLVAPVRRQGAWTLAEDGTPIWRKPYVQLWQHVVSPDGSRIAAVVATSYGRWTVAVDDVPWRQTFGDLVGAPQWAPTSDRVAVMTKEDNRWGIAVDGVSWPETWDMVWDPVFSPNGRVVAAKVERGGRFTYVVDGRPWSESFSRLWEPVFSPDGGSLLVRGVQEDVYLRRVVPLAEVRHV